MSVDESVEQASLRRIREQTRAVDECESILSKAESVLVDAKAGRDAAKEAWMQSLRDLRDLSREETIGLPLFPALRDEPPAFPPETFERPQVPPQPEPTSRDETTFLLSIGINPVVSVKLGAADVQTVLDLRHYLASGRELTDIDGIEAKEYKHIMGKLKKWDERQTD